MKFLGLMGHTRMASMGLIICLYTLTLFDVDLLNLAW